MGRKPGQARLYQQRALRLPAAWCDAHGFDFQFATGPGDSFIASCFVCLTSVSWDFVSCG